MPQVPSHQHMTAVTISHPHKHSVTEHVSQAYTLPTCCQHRQGATSFMSQLKLVCKLSTIPTNGYTTSWVIKRKNDHKFRHLSHQALSELAIMTIMYYDNVLFHPCGFVWNRTSTVLIDALTHKTNDCVHSTLSCHRLIQHHSFKQRPAHPSFGRVKTVVDG